MTEVTLAKRWLRLIRDAEQIAYAERLNSLRGRYVKRFADDGLHPFSVVIGQIGLIEGLLDVPSPLRVHPMRLRDQATRRANLDFVEGLREGKEKLT